ncbi:MAG: hypothetical protein Q8M31_23665, partial [Beijerinckiaceae bacterium]|nr:hypothetical protein [Beijerinckiaceae bacterium]
MDASKLKGRTHLILDSTNTESVLSGALESGSPPTCVIVDFDETLGLFNSTELYLATLRPRFLALLILGLIDLARPWALLRGPRKRFLYRDWLRVLITSILLPWSLFLWRRRAPEIVKRRTNEPLLAALTGANVPIHVATFGFRALVAPLLKHMAPNADLCVAGSFWAGYRNRSRGKRACVEERLDVDTVAGAVFITDGLDDEDLLQACRTPLLVYWKHTAYEPAFFHHYMPFVYTERGKRMGQRYLLHNVILEDVLLLCIAFAWLMPSPFLGAIGILMLHMSFWTIYEIGYWENDVIAVKNEAKPNLPAGAAAYATRMHPWMAWLTAAIIAAPGMALLTYFNFEAMPLFVTAYSWPIAFVSMLGLWFAYLALSRMVYWFYNRIDTNSRAYLYIGLQMSRTIGYAIFFYTNLAGILLLTALIVGRWLPYFSYRQSGQA